MTRRVALAAALWPAAASPAQPLAQVLLVPDPRAGALPVAQLRALLEAMDLELTVVDAGAMSPAQALAAVRRAWFAQRELKPWPPMALAGHGFGATLALAMVDELDPREWPRLLWLLAPNGASPWALTAVPGVPEALLRPEAALARIDALCTLATAPPTRLLIVQGQRDATVPPARSRAFADAAPSATLYRVPDAGRDDLLAGEEARARLRRLFFEQVHLLRRSYGLRG